MYVVIAALSAITWLSTTACGDDVVALAAVFAATSNASDPII